MLDKRSSQLEIIDNLSFSDPLLISNLNEMEKINRWLGYHRIMLKGISKIYNQFRLDLNNSNMVLADIGCGSADALRVIHQWMKKRHFQCELIGIDANEFVLRHAKTQCAGYQIKFEQKNVLAEIKDGQYDLIILNHFCHHLKDEELVDLLKSLICQTRFAIIINDLHRHILAYWGIKALAKIFNLSKLTKHDGPLSVLRGFRKNELNSLLIKAGIDSFEIKWHWPFRWQIVIWNHYSQERMHGQ